MCVRSEVAVGKEKVNVGLGVSVFVAMAGVAEMAIVAEAFLVAVSDAVDIYFMSFPNTHKPLRTVRF